MLHHKQTVNIVIVDDHPIVIEGLRNLIDAEPMLHVKAHFTSGSDFMAYLNLKNDRVDIVLLDITLPDDSGIHFCKEISKFHPEVKILAISNLSERNTIRQMLQSGASGYLLKTASAADIVACVKLALQGEIALSNEVKLILSRPDLDTTGVFPELTKRERQILHLLAKGKKSAEIAAELFISPLTVKTHRATLMQKFNVNNMVSLVNRAKEYGMV
ncbi:two-component system response regulator DegU [Olivibacter ginsenosidimutans]|uniref:Two-component system response regulator DegU n=1 Tax=Olivibacter ginsenosidimutans TaxID=1176537 RepID=A0ABP9BPM9_9SPHI